MAIRKVLQRGDHGLALPNEEVTVKAIPSAKVQNVIRDLFDTMHAVDLIAMAAPQIGVNLSIFITEIRKTKARNQSETDAPRVFINPEILKLSQETSRIYEGCGSVLGTGRFGPVVRPKELTITALDEHGRRFKLHCNGLLARAIQHEYDHLKGMEFLDVMAPGDELITQEEYVANVKDTPEHKAASKVTIKECSFDIP